MPNNLRAIVVLFSVCFGIAMFTAYVAHMKAGEAYEAALDAQAEAASLRAVVRVLESEVNSRAER